MLVSTINHNCTSFSVLPKTLDESSKIEGMYFNDSHTEASYPRKLWSLIKYKNEIKEASLLIKIELKIDELKENIEGINI